MLEHIEPECLDAVLDDLRRVTRKAGLFEVSTVLGGTHLPDGRDAHLIVEPLEWWRPKIEARFRVEHVECLPGRFAMQVAPEP